MLLPRPASVRGGREVRVILRDALPDGEEAGNVACLALGLAVKSVADAADVQCASPELVGFVLGFRHRLTACLQYLREEAYRRGVRDAVRAAAQALDGGKVQRGLVFFRGVLERLASASTEGASLSGGGDLSARALREVSKKVVGMQGTHMVTWNVAGDDVASGALKNFKKEDKAAWLRNIVERWSEVDILAVQESPTPGVMAALTGLYRLLGSCESHAGGRFVQLYVRQRVEAQFASTVAGAPAVAAWLTFDTAQVLVVSAHLAAGAAFAKERARQMRAISKYVDAQVVERSVVCSGAVGVVVGEKAISVRISAWSTRT